MDNAIVGGRWAKRYAYVHGYYIAGTLLSKEALGNQPQDLLFYPICYNFRHAVELHLKALIVEAERLHEAFRLLGEKVGDMPETPQKLMKWHGLSDLLTHVRAQLKVFTDEEMESEVVESILDLDAVDFDGQAFRYNTRTGGAPSLPDDGLVDVKNIMDRMDRTRWHLAGVDAWMGEKRDMAEGLISDLSNNSY